MTFTTDPTTVDVMMERGTAQEASRRPPLRRPPVDGRSATIGIIAALGMVSVYAAVLGTFGGWPHLVDQAGDDRYWLAAIVPGFGLQVALLVELRRRHAGGMVAAGAGAASSTTGMVACCLHHVAEVAPLLGLGGLATVAVDWKPWLLGTGVAITGAMIARSWWHLTRPVEGESCHAS